MPGAHPADNAKAFGPARTSAGVTIGMASAIAAVLTFLSLAALFAWSILAPGPYPNASRTGWRLPGAHVDVRGGCVQWIVIGKAYYTAPQDEITVIGTLKQAGWMGNFRYHDSVLKQTSRQYGPIYLTRVNEIFVENRSAGANLVSMTQFTVSLGRC